MRQMDTISLRGHQKNEHHASRGSLYANIRLGKEKKVLIFLTKISSLLGYSFDSPSLDLPLKA